MLLTLVAIVGGRAAYVKVMQSMSKVTTVAPAEQVADDAEQAEEAAPADAAVVAEREQPEVVRRGATEGTKLPKPTVNDYKEMEVVWMAVASLAAYVIGKGSGKAPPPESMPSAPEETSGTPA